MKRIPAVFSVDDIVSQELVNENDASNSFHKIFVEAEKWRRREARSKSPRKIKPSSYGNSSQ